MFRVGGFRLRCPTGGFVSRDKAGSTMVNQSRRYVDVEMPLREPAASLGRRRTAADAKPPSDGSAHPDANNYDPEQANAIIGDLAENVRKYLADKQKCRPPGLQTEVKDDGSIVVTADNPEVGVGLKVTIQMLAAKPVPTPEADGGLQVGPPPVGPPSAPAAAPAAPPPPQLQVGPPAAPPVM